MSETVTINLPLDAIRDYCKTQPIRRLSVFGSAARDELTQRAILTCWLSMSLMRPSDISRWRVI